VNDASVGRSDTICLQLMDRRASKSCTADLHMDRQSSVLSLASVSS